MKNQERIRERYLRDPLSVRLAGLAADLSRVASSARRETGGEAVAAMLEESQYLIEWMGAEAPVEVAEELVNLQVMLALWRRAWPEAQHSQLRRSLLAVQAKQWTDRVLGYSGLAMELESWQATAGEVLMDFEAPRDRRMLRLE